MGWISQPPLSVHSSVGKYLVLAYMPCDPKGGCLLHSTTRLNLPIESSVNKHLILAYIPRDPKGGCFVLWSVAMPLRVQGVPRNTLT